MAWHIDEQQLGDAWAPRHAGRLLLVPARRHVKAYAHECMAIGTMPCLGRLEKTSKDVMLQVMHGSDSKTC